MAKQNKVTEISPYNKADKTTTQTLQDHIDENNANGYCIIAVEFFNGKYRIFWEKVI